MVAPKMNVVAEVAGSITRIVFLGYVIFKCASEYFLAVLNLRY